MRIGIDISQLAFPNTGVSNYLEKLVVELVKSDKHEYVLFFSSLRGKVPASIEVLLNRKNVSLKHIKIPPSALHVMWNVVHLLDVQTFVGSVDLFITSDWTEPPVKNAKKATIIYDTVVYKYPEETHSKTEFGIKKFKLSQNIVDVQKKKLSWVKKETDIAFCISEQTKKDVHEILGMPLNKLFVVYPGF